MTIIAVWCDKGCVRGTSSELWHHMGTRGRTGELCSAGRKQNGSCEQGEQELAKGMGPGEESRGQRGLAESQRP